MKRILITGKNSYIGNEFEKWIKQWPGKYQVDKISVRNGQWTNQNWSNYDVIFHVAGIVHNSVKHEDEGIYYDVNRDLAFEVANKAKNEGIKHFIFMSTMSVYGVNKGRITQDTSLSPTEIYGITKLEAEEKISTLANVNFKVSIIRPPMVYGKNAPGNYSKLSKIAQISPIFPKINNKRSMIFIDNLSNFILKVIESESSGIFCPQNSEYVNVQNMVETISKYHSKKIFFTGLFNGLLESLNLKKVSKVIDDLYYDLELSTKEISNYNVVSFEKSIQLSESIND